MNIVESVGVDQTRSVLRSTSSTDFTLPRLSTKFTERAFSHNARNALPQDLRVVVVRILRQKKRKFCTSTLRILRIIFVNSAQILRTLSSRFFHFKITSAVALLYDPVSHTSILA